MLGRVNFMQIDNGIGAQMDAKPGSGQVYCWWFAHTCSRRCDALQRACGHAKFWKSRDRYRELIIVGDLNIMHETSAKILQISSWVVPSFIHGNKITAVRLVFFKFSFFLNGKTNERNVHGPKGMVILHNFMCSLLPCLFVFRMFAYSDPFS